MKAVIIEWVDSSGVQGGWQFTEDFETELVKVTSIGFIIKETDDYIALTANLGEATKVSSRQINGVITIPKCAIQTISSFETSIC